MFWARLWTGLEMTLEKYQPEKYIHQLEDRPLLLIHGKSDGMIPYTETLILYEAANKKPELWLIEGYNHIESIVHPEYRKRLSHFFGKVNIPEELIAKTEGAPNDI